MYQNLRLTSTTSLVQQTCMVADALYRPPGHAAAGGPPMAATCVKAPFTKICVQPGQLLWQAAGHLVLLPDSEDRPGIEGVSLLCDKVCGTTRLLVPVADRAAAMF
jgi:hypothetical protein